MLVELNSKRSIIYFLSVIVGLIVFLLFSGIVFSYDEGNRVEITGLIDRFEDDSAVILLEDIGEELILPPALLPQNSQDDTYLKLEVVPVTPRIMSKNN
ncbi:DUF3006 family protein [Oceanobacillus damuensis]|uniref:DUF3006 family protein n=1 Tax=Oceanobacillus damuensis TaxID=937928 RepID=UPI00082CA03C|nr:DUF3006 family protein [Oceanobacillus damuensis]